MDQKRDKDIEILARLRNYMRFMKGYGQLTVDIARYTKSSPRTVYRWIKAETMPSKHKIQLIKSWLDTQEDKEMAG